MFLHRGFFISKLRANAARKQRVPSRHILSQIRITCDRNSGFPGHPESSGNSFSKF